MTKNQSPIWFNIGLQADPKPNPRHQLPTPTLTINNNSHGGLRKQFFYFQCMVIFDYNLSTCTYQSIYVVWTKVYRWKFTNFQKIIFHKNYSKNKINSKFINDFSWIKTFFSIVSRFMIKNQSPSWFSVGLQALSIETENPRP